MCHLKENVAIIWFLESLVISKMHLNYLLQTSTLEGKNHSIENCASFGVLSMHACMHYSD